MHTGDLNRRVTIQTPTLASDGAGGQVSTDVGIKASSVLGLAANPTAGKVMVIGARTYTFRAALSTGPTVPDEILIGASASVTKTNIIAALNAGATAGTNYSIGTAVHAQVIAEDAGSPRTIAVTARGAGTAGNSIVTTTDDSALSWAAATLEDGANPTAVTTLPELPTTGLQAWANIVPLRGSQLLAAQQLHADTRWRVTLRYRTDLNPGMRFCYPVGSDFSYLEIVSVLPDQPGGWVMCDCREWTP